MTAPERRRPLPALAFIAALTVLTALVWFRVIHRTDKPVASKPSCSTSTSATGTGVTVVPVPAKVTVVVLNSTQKSGFAKSTKKLLTDKGFKVSDFTDDTPANGGHGLIKGVAEIRFGPDAKAAATLLKYYVEGATYVPNDSSTSTVSLAIGAKFKTLRTTAQVKKLMGQFHVKQTAGPLPTATPTKSATC